jgi:hypothetical protein
VFLLCLLLPFGCASAPEVNESSDSASDLEFVNDLARIFYDRVSNRRFNSIATFQDPGLHEFFDSEESFADYFAELVQHLTDAYFEQVRANVVTIESLEQVDPDLVLVTVTFEGENGRPLRWWDVRLTRVDRWKRTDGHWWIVPGKV